MTQITQKTLLTEDDFNKVQKRFTELVDSETFSREVSYAIQAINNSKRLKECDQASFYSALMNVANIGLTLNPVHKLAYLIPRWDGLAKKMVCDLMPSYQGLVKLLTDTGSIVNVVSHIVYDNDEFSITQGTREEVKHKPKAFGDRGKIVGVYAVATLKEGIQQTEVMSVDDVNEIRDNSDSYKAFVEKKIQTCVWNDHWSEMARKTIIKRLAKHLPKTNKWDKVAEAIEIDNVEYTIGHGYMNYIATLIDNSAFDPEMQEGFHRELATCSPSRAEEMVMELKNNQLNPLTHGRGGNQTEIKLNLQP